MYPRKKHRHIIPRRYGSLSKEWDRQAVAEGIRKAQEADAADKKIQARWRMLGFVSWIVAAAFAAFVAAILILEKIIFR